jgi:RNA polymerase sigma-70 factor (ECF subfamily)
MDFEAILTEHQDRVFRLCASMLGSRRDAEDAAQEVFLKAYQNLHKFKGDSAVGTWLHRIAANHCLDLLRKRARRPAEPLTDELGRRLFSKEPDLEALDLAHRALSQLPEDYRLALTLRELQGFTYEEIAEITESSLDSVKARLRRAREQLQEKLRHFLKDSDV